MRILSVDDDPIVLELLKEILGHAGYSSVHQVESGGEALKLLDTAAAEFDCFLLDIQMPGMDGIELCRRIRALPQYAKTPILMLTAMSEKSYIDGAFAAGATDYVTKPFDVTEVITRVRLAENLFEERRRNQEQNIALLGLEGELETKGPELLQEPFSISDVDGLIDCVAFENYILQLSRGRRFMSAALAVKVSNISTIFERCSARYFRYFVADFAEAMSDSLKRHGFLMSYRGTGTFVVAFDRRFSERLMEDLRSELPQKIGEVSPVFDDGTPIAVDVTIGDPKSQGVLSARGALDPLHKTIESAEYKAMNRLREAGSMSWNPGTLFQSADRIPEPVYVMCGNRSNSR